MTGVSIRHHQISVVLSPLENILSSQTDSILGIFTNLSLSRHNHIITNLPLDLSGNFYELKSPRHDARKGETTRPRDVRLRTGVKLNWPCIGHEEDVNNGRLFISNPSNEDEP